LLAAHLRLGDVIVLKGGLATGKTTFVKAVAAAMGSQVTVTSPTFTLAHFYPLEHGTILHVDAYRLSGIIEYRDLGLEEYLPEAVTLIEWGEKVADDFPSYLMVEFHYDPIAPEQRVIAFSTQSPRWRPVVDALQTKLPDNARLS
jgi:tRNA threonylcarbamoyladenosine biosynthesis protein TsaE